jgi:hypothetical protein
MGLRVRVPAQEVPGQFRIGEPQQLGERTPLLGKGARQHGARKALEQNIQFLQAPTALPQQAAAFLIEPRRGAGVACGGWRVPRHAQLRRSISIFLMAAIALAGFRSFGHTSVQFMMV